MEDIKVSFQQFYEKFINTPLEDRNYNIPIYYNISNDEWKIVNKVVHDFIISIEEVNLWIINVIQYSAIVTVLSRHNKLNTRISLRENKQHKTGNCIYHINY